MRTKQVKKEDHQQVHYSLNGVKWAIAIALLVAGFVLNGYYQSVAWAIRASIGILFLVAILALLALTKQGAIAIEFFKGAQLELRKVVWPTRQETVQTTLVVVGMVVLMALLLWGLDAIFIWMMSWLSGQHGG